MEHSIIFIKELFFQADYSIFIKLLFACLLGGIIGLEREIKRKPVGIKTCIIIAVTTCLLTIVSIKSAEYFASLSENIRTDPMRLAAQVISGIGFIGTGVIMRKTNDVISGITTASMIWAAAGIGISVGAGFIYSVIIMTLIILFILRFSPKLASHLHKQERINKLSIKLEIDNIAILQLITDNLKQNACYVTTVNIKETSSDLLNISINAKMSESGSSYDVYTHLKKLVGVNNIEVRYVLD
ncbi:MgtC/SapB family protein [[Haemophilus] felis]|nr:MgtC/SapB family protein [[Haemophilus] felis]